MHRLNLGGKWILRQLDSKEQITAHVPGSVFNDLLTAGMIPDPYYRDNAALVKEWANYDYEYIKEFMLPEKLCSCDQILLCCDGLDTLAEIRLNGLLLAKTKNMHRRYAYEVQDYLQQGTNTLSIILRSPIKYVTERQLQNPLWGANDTIPGFPHLRKAHYMFGWDWGPQLPDLGILRDICICGYTKGRLDDVYITQNHTRASVQLAIQVKRSWWANEPAIINVQVLTPDDAVITEQIPAPHYEEHVSIEIHNPQLWWPNGYGNQPLYHVVVSLQDSSEAILDQIRLRIGLRTLRIRQERDQWGESFGFEVNGVPIFAKGANYIPEDNLLARLNPDRTEALIRACVDAHFNCLRVWGGGIYPDNYFYDLCDQHGIIVWQDLMFACALYDFSSEFANEVAQEVADNVRRLRHHPCLGVWCGNNEVESALTDWDIPKTDKQRQEYLLQFEKIIPEIVSELCPHTYYWPSSPSSGGGFVAPSSPDRGDVHFWQVWHELKPFETYQQHYFRFLSEFGFQSFPHYRTIASFTSPEERNIFSYVIEQHQKHPTGNAKILAYIANNYPYPNGLKALIYISQLLQAEAIKYGVEHLRRHRGRCMGALYWQLNDCWPAVSWSSIDYYQRWKALHYAAKRFYAPVLVSAAVEDQVIRIYLTNDQREAVHGLLVWQIRDHTGAVITEKQLEVCVPALSARLVDTIDISCWSYNQRQKHYLEYSFAFNKTELSTRTVPFVKPKHFLFRDPQLQVQVEETADHYRLVVSAAAFAKDVYLDFSDHDVVFSDNFFDLSPGAIKQVLVNKAGLPEEWSCSDVHANLIVFSLYHAIHS